MEQSLTESRRLALMNSLRINLQEVEKDLRSISSKMSLHQTLTIQKKDIQERMKKLFKEAPPEERNKLAVKRGPKKKLT